MAFEEEPAIYSREAFTFLHCGGERRIVWLIDRTIIDNAEGVLVSMKPNQVDALRSEKSRVARL